MLDLTNKEKTFHAHIMYDGGGLEYRMFDSLPAAHQYIKSQSDVDFYQIILGICIEDTFHEEFNEEAE